MQHASDRAKRTTEATKNAMHRSQHTLSCPLFLSVPQEIRNRSSGAQSLSLPPSQPLSSLNLEFELKGSGANDELGNEYVFVEPLNPISPAQHRIHRCQRLVFTERRNFLASFGVHAHSLYSFVILADDRGSHKLESLERRALRIEGEHLVLKVIDGRVHIHFLLHHTFQLVEQLQIEEVPGS
jgi:hypothetical protein